MRARLVFTPPPTRSSSPLRSPLAAPLRPASGGHYTASVQDPTTGQWWAADDDKMTPLKKPEDAVTQKAYFLFYRRRGTESAAVREANNAAETATPSTPAQ